MSEVFAAAFLCLMAVEMVVFLGTYAMYSPWWSTTLGRIYIAKTAMFTLVLTQNAASVLFDSDYPGRHPLRLAIYAGGSIMMVVFWWTLRRIQREGKAARLAAGDNRNRREVWADAIRDIARRHCEHPDDIWRDVKKRPPL